MELRRRTPQHLAAQSEAGAKDNGVSEEQSAPSVTVRRPEFHAEKQCNLAGTALVEEVIGVLGRVDLLNAASLKALRSTCTAFRDLVDATDATSTAKFNVARRGHRDLLETWAAGTRLTPRTRSLSISYAGPTKSSYEMPATLAEQILSALCTHRPPISKLNLRNLGAQAEKLLTAPLDTLRELCLASGAINPRSLIDNTPPNGIQVLSIEEMNDIEASDLAAALVHFRDLQSLRLKHTRMKGTPVHPGVLENALIRLETLEVWWCGDVDKLGLLDAAGPELPALRTFKLGNRTMAPDCLWLRHLTKLSLERVRVTGPGVAEALSGGPLEDLRIHLSSPDAYAHWNWSRINLPHLTRLELPEYQGDAMAAVARARLPTLRSIALPFNHSNTVSGVRAFAPAFPALRELKILEERLNEDLPADAVKALALGIVPRLESLQWSAEMHSSKITGLLHSLLPAGAADGAPCWPRLRLLDLDLRHLQSHWAPDLQGDAYQSLARAAPHAPSLVSLRAFIGNDTSPEALDAFVAAAEEVQAWPLMQKICVQRSDRYWARYNFAEELHEVWPQATVE